MPKVAISACQGHLGKTLASVGLCYALRRRGLTIQPFKKGPDYIDPSWLGAAAGRPCRNLDAFLMPKQALLSSFQKGCCDADLALIEGTMGLYDSFSINGRGSTAWIARLLGTPVILIVNASRMTRSVAAMINGFRNFEPDTHIGGVILNNATLAGHKRRLIAAIERYCNVPVLGLIPKDEDLRIADREHYLGLMPFREGVDSQSIVERIGRRLENYLDVNGIMDIASHAHAIPPTQVPASREKTTSVRIGVLLDRAFTFYYPENMEALAERGAELVFINSMEDHALPDVDALWIGGGFPEFFLEELEANRGLRRDINEAVQNGLPVYAECGGLMYLCRGIHRNGRQYEMVGAIPAGVEICHEPQGHGYKIARVIRENPWFPKGLNIRGHQFHFSRLRSLDNLDFVYEIKRGRSGDSRIDGIVYKNVFASYTHLHALGTPEWAEAFISLAIREQEKKAIKML